MNIRTRGEKIFAVFNYFLMTLIGIVTFYPLWHVFMVSISDPDIVFGERGFYLWPKGSISFMGYGLVFDNPNIISGIFNTTFYVVAGTVLGMVFTILGAYVLSRPGLYWNKLVMKMIIFTMYFQGGLIPFYVQVESFGMMNSRWAIILPTLVATWNLIVLRTGFAAVSPHLIESAKIDGASDWRIVWQIAVPVTNATIAVIALFYAVRYWNEWFNSSLFLKEKELWPLQLVLREILLDNNTDSMMGSVAQAGQERYRMLVKYCTIIVATVPILIVYPFVQRYFVSGMMIGSVKG